MTDVRVGGLFLHVVEVEPLASVRVAGLYYNVVETEPVNPAYDGALGLSGSGALTLTASAGFSVSLALSGSGTLTFAVIPTAIQTLALSGSGTLGGTGVVVGTLALDGSGSLGLGSGTPGLVTSLGLSGSGTLGLAGTVAVSGSISFSGSGTLTMTDAILATMNLSGTGALSFGTGVPAIAASIALAGSGALYLTGMDGSTEPGSLILFGSGLLIMDGAGGLPLPAVMGNRWILWDPDDPSILPYYLDINPNRMGSPNIAKNFDHARSARQPKDTISIAGMARTRSFKRPSPPATWEFGGVILTQAQHDVLLEWSKRDGKVNITDHLGRTFEVMMQQFDPVERRPTALKQWRFDYTMRVLLLRQLAVTF